MSYDKHLDVTLLLCHLILISTQLSYQNLIIRPKRGGPVGRDPTFKHKVPCSSRGGYRVGGGCPSLLCASLAGSLGVLG